jgi:hypothetical protein
MNSIRRRGDAAIRHDLIDSYDEEPEMELEDRPLLQLTGEAADTSGAAGP